LLHIETTVMPGKGELVLTGTLGDVMKESAKAALSYVRTRGRILDLPDTFYEKVDIHVHIPEGATPKDGPSAGVSIFSAVASIFTQRKVKGTLAMTGEITLRGLVLPVGGIKEKVLAAKRAGIEKVLLPKKNEKDVEEIEKDVIGNLEIEYLERMDPLLDIVLDSEPVEDPKKRFEVSDRHKSQNGVDGKTKDSTEETIVME